MAEHIDEYIINPETLMADIPEEKHHQGWKLAGVSVAGLLLFFFYIWIVVSVLGWNLPKTVILKRQNDDWRTCMAQMSQQLDRYDELLSLLEMRDDRIYRSIYGMDDIPQAVRMAGLAGETRYDEVEGTSLAAVTRRLDVLEKRAYVQSKSFDEVALLQQNAGDMAAHIPAIPPINTEPSSFRLSSSFGFRSDPILGFARRHTGMDFACPSGNPIYVTGDGIVVKVARDHAGYGNHVEVDHGFGYKTRYAHMSHIDVEEGQAVRRGDCLGLSGNSGRSTGPHLHYEVIYRKNYVNPILYMDLSIPASDYAAMVRKPEK